MSVPAVAAYRKRVAYHSGLLGFFALFATTALILSYDATKEDIDLRMKEDLKITLSKVVPDNLYDNDIANDKIRIAAPNLLSKDSAVEIYIARKQKTPVALAYEVVAPDGYSGPIVLMMGVNMQGEILGTRVITHAETPGLGDNIEVKKSKWILSFDGLSLSNTRKQAWAVKKDGGQFDQFSGATITPRAVVKAIHRGLEFYQQRKDDILKESMNAQVTS